MEKKAFVPCNLEDNWTNKIFVKAQEEIKDEELIPIVVFTWKQSNPDTIRLLRGYKGKVYVYRHKDYPHNYTDINLAEENTEIYDFIDRLNDFFLKDIDQYIRMDDDIRNVNYSIEGVNHDGSYKAKRIKIGINPFVKTWMYTMKKVGEEYNWALSSPFHGGFAHFYDLVKNKYILSNPIAACMQIIMVNSKVIKEKNPEIRFGFHNGWEDFAFNAELTIKNNLGSHLIKWMQYQTKNMGDNSLYDNKDKVKFRQEVSDNLVKAFPKYAFLKETKGLPNSRMRWIKMKNDFLELTKKERENNMLLDKDLLCVYKEYILIPSEKNGYVSDYYFEIGDSFGNSLPKKIYISISSAPWDDNLSEEENKKLFSKRINEEINLEFKKKVDELISK